MRIDIWFPQTKRFKMNDWTNSHTNLQNLTSIKPTIGTQEKNCTFHNFQNSTNYFSVLVPPNKRTNFVYTVVNNITLKCCAGAKSFG